MPYRSTEIKSYFGPASKFRHGEWYIGCQMYVVTGRAANGQLKMESGKFHMAAAAFPAQGCRAGENVAALTAQPLAALPPYGCGVPLAGSERLTGDYSTAERHWCTARSPDVSLRGAKRRGNLAEHGRTTGKPSAKSQLPSRDCHGRKAPSQ